MTLETISLAELQDLWPKTDDGRMCARLLVRYGFTFMIESALGAQCTAERAQAESGASKAISKMVTDFGTLGLPTRERPKKTPMAQLHRFSEQQPPSEEKK